MAETFGTFGAQVVIDEKINNSVQFGAEYSFNQIFNKVTRARTETLKNNSGAEVTYPAGLIMGRLNVDGNIMEFVSTATAGNQYPIGAIGAEITLADGAEEKVTMAYECDMPESNIKFAGSEDLYTTIVDGKLLIDRFQTDCRINVTQSAEATTSDTFPT